MVVLLDLDEECLDPPDDPRNAPFHQNRKPQTIEFLNHVLKSPDAGNERPNPNINGFSAILACYP